MNEYGLSDEDYEKIKNFFDLWICFELCRIGFKVFRNLKYKGRCDDEV